MRHIALSILFIASVSICKAYDWDPSVYEVGKKYPGYVITNEGDTIEGFIEAKSRCNITAVSKSNQNYCEFYKNENDKKPTGKYKPDDISGYMVADKIYRSIAYSGGLSKSNGFCLLKTDGRICVYDYYITQEGGATMVKSDDETWEEYDTRRYTTNVVLQKGDERPRESTWYLMSFAKRMAELVEDYEELAESIRNKEKGYRIDKFYDIIEEYNIWYAANADQ
jgi:hypothetical protein